MGDPKKIRKKYDTPAHPWIKSRIDEEKIVRIEFGTRNKKEIWKMESSLKNFKTQAKTLLPLRTAQADIEKKHLFRRVKELGVISGEPSFDAVLGMTLSNIMGRRLQSIVFKKGLARTIKQARQFIVHEHVLVDGRKITSPSYLVSVKEESSVEFASSSPFINEEHPERAQPEVEAAKKAEAEAPVVENIKEDAKVEVKNEGKAK